MKFAIALLATLVLSGSGNSIRKLTKSGQQNPIEQQFAGQFPEINQPKIQERIFKDGSEYRYLYDGQILTGMPDINNQYSGARIRAVVKIQLGQKDLMQIEKVFVGSLHERFVSNPQTLIQLDAFEQIQEQDAPFEEVLKKPVRFTYENGKISNFEVVEDEPSWSINIKRAILSTFHLSLTDREQPEEEMRQLNPQMNEVRGQRRQQQGSQSQMNENEEYFTVMEDGIGGRCEASYLILSVPNQPEFMYPIYDTESTQQGRPQIPKSGSAANFNVLNVTKTFNHRNCEFRPFNFKGLHFSSPCPHCESDPNSFFEMLESAAHTRYNITGNKQQYIIDSAVTEAVYKVTPRSHYAGSLVAYANVTTILISSGPVSAQQIQFPEQNSNQIDGLHMVDAKFSKREGDKVIFETPEATRPIIQKLAYWPNVANKPQKIRAIFERLIQGMSQKEVVAETANLIDDITRLMAYSQADELEQTWNQIQSISAEGFEKEEVQHVFADLLVSAGTKCSFTFLKKLMMEQKLKGSVLNDVLALMSHKMDINDIDTEVVEQMLELCQNGQIEQDVFAKRACWLSFGTLVHKACAHTNFDARVAWKEVEGKYNGQSSQGSKQQRRQQTRGQSGDQDEVENLRCPVALRQRVAQQVASKIQSADEEEKILLIKTLGNMGLKETLPQLEQAAEDENLPVYIRTQAIYAMRHVAPVQPEDVLSVLMPLYRKTQNPTQIRIAAFVIILAAQPELPIFEDLVQSLNQEPDLDVASFVYSSMSTLANVTDPCLKNVTRDIRLALEIAPAVNADWRHSKSIHRGEYMPQLKSGLFYDLSTVMDKDAPAPRSGNFRIHANIMKKSLELFEVTFETEGMGEALRKFAGNLTKEHLADVLSGRASRRPRQAGQDVPVPEDLAEINQLLNIQPKDPKAVRGTASIKIFGQETRFVVINPQTVSRFLVELIAQSQSVVPKLLGEGLPIDNRRALLLLNTRLEIPSVLGVPIGTSIRLPIFGGLKGKLKVQVEPKPQAGPSGFLTQLPQKLTIDSDLQTQIAGEIHCKLSVYMAFLKIGTGVRTKLSMNLPVDGKVEFNLQDRSSKFTMDLPENPIKLVKMQSYPVTFVTRFSKNEQTYQPKSIPERPQQSHQEIDADETEEERTFRHQQQHQRQQGQQGQKYLKLQVQPVPTEFITPNGHVQFKNFAGLPVPVPELWEITTPDFVKSRQMNFTIGHESLAAEISFNGQCEYPDTRLPMQWLPVLASKQNLEIIMTPKKGAKKIVVTAFERSHFTLQSDKDLLTKLQDKLPGINVKDVSKPNTPKDYEKFPKLGHSLQIMVNSEGSDAPDTWTTRGLLALIYSIDGRYIKTVAAMESKMPVLAKKVCLAGELRYPDRNNMWFVTPQDTLNNKSVQGNLELSWGDDCGAEKMVKLRLRIQKTEEQRDIEKHGLYDVTGIPVPEDVAHEVSEGENLFTPLHKQCQQDRQRGAFFSKDCVDLAIRYSELLRLKLDIEYKNVSRSIRRVLHRVEGFTRAVFAWNTDIEDVDVQNQENKISAVVEVSADRSYVDIKYRTPRQNVNITNIDMPYNVQPVSALFPWNPSRMVGLIQPPTCTLTGPKISTFDDVSDEQPLSGSCWHVLVKDNSQDDLFAVLVANVAKNSIAKKVAVLFKGHRIEVVPKGGQVPTGDQNKPVGIKNFIVKYNGQELPDALTPEKRTTIPPNTPQDKQELADIMLIKPETSGNSEPIVGIVSYPTGLMVLFDGSSVTVMPSPFWKGGVVGLCGPYNGQPWDDLLLPNKTMASTAEDYSRAFMIPRAGCDAQIPQPQERQKTRQ